MAFDETYTATISIKDVYGCLPKCPEGYEIAHFRPPIKGECVIERTEPQGHYESAFDFPSLSPRLILRKVSRRRVIFEETGECRFARNGEWIETAFNTMNQILHEHLHPRPVRIFTRREETF